MKLGYFLLSWIVGALLMGFWTDRTLDFWLTHFKGEVVDVNFFVSVLASLTGPIAFFMNVVSEIARAYMF